jgi:hypothetical protein
MARTEGTRSAARSSAKTRPACSWNGCTGRGGAARPSRRPIPTRNRKLGSQQGVWAMREILVTPDGSCGEIVRQALRPWLADVESGADRAD